MPRSTAAIAGVAAAVLLTAVATVAIRGTGDPQDDAPSAQVQTETEGESTDEPTADAAATEDVTTEPTSPDDGATEDPDDETTDATTTGNGTSGDGDETATTSDDGTADDSTGGTDDADDGETAVALTGGTDVDDLPETGGGALTALGASLALGAGVTARRRRDG